jgi:geranylgeranyl diphosphate synthase type II
LKRTCWPGFIHPCRVGALIARPDHENLEAFTEFGYYLGAAWRIQAEISELIESRGRTIGERGDADEAAPTLIVTHLLQQTSPSDRTRARGLLELPRHRRPVRDMDWLHDLFRRHGSVDFASARARELAAAADGALARALGQSPANADRDFLGGTIRHVAGLAAA